MSKILVTGASGHLGFHLVQLLLKENHEVCCFVRKTSFIEHLKKLPVEICYGDLFDKDSLHKALGGVTKIFHTGAVFNLSPTDNNNIVKTAVMGVENLFSVIKENYPLQIERIVYTSSVETIGVSNNKDKPLNEENYVEDFKHPYCEAKNRAEKLALKLAEENNVELVICNPSTIIGENDFRITPSNQMILSLASNVFPIYVDSGQNLVHVEDVAMGHILAMKRGKPSERYILCGENISMKNLIKKIKAITGGITPFIPIPQICLKSIGLLCELEGKLLNKPLRFSRQRAENMVGKYTYYQYNKSAQELGYNPKPLDSFLKETLQWLLSQEKKLLFSY
ncbi:MAG: NAD-dependent epimerase/dehydratase family protein [Nitrospinae bacterium]|nr:NAD-dependent epimerase/dehydratase family protein [Nitrospinota bacterium]